MANITPIALRGSVKTLDDLEAIPPSDGAIYYVEQEKSPYIYVQPPGKWVSIMQKKENEHDTKI